SSAVALMTRTYSPFWLISIAGDREHIRAIRRPANSGAVRAMRTGKAIAIRKVCPRRVIVQFPVRCRKDGWAVSSGEIAVRWVNRTGGSWKLVGLHGSSDDANQKAPLRVAAGSDESEL